MAFYHTKLDEITVLKHSSHSYVAAHCACNIVIVEKPFSLMSEHKQLN